MKKSLVSKADGKYGNGQIRLIAREELLQREQIAPGDDQTINARIRGDLSEAKKIATRLNQKRDLDLAPQCLALIMAIWLLGSEPISRRQALQQSLSKQGVSAQSDTTLFSLIMKAVGLYPPEARRHLSRDSAAVEYAMTLGMRPWTLESYFRTPGQGRDATYKRAREQHGSGNGSKSLKTTANRETHARIDRLPADTPYITYTIRTRAGSTVKSCIIDPRNVKAVTKFVKDLLLKGKSDTQRIRPSDRVLSKRPLASAQSGKSQRNDQRHRFPRPKSF
jgi:hypothetical protein